MIRAIAIDDEPLALDILKRFAGEVDTLELVATFTSARNALDFLGKESVDLIFLDIQMPGMDGITFYEQLKTKPKLIFTTAHPDFAVHGFDIGAVDYLLKPFSAERFKAAIERVLHRKTSESTGDDELILRANYGLVRLSMTEIGLIESFGDYAHIHLDGKDPLEIRITLKKLSERLPKDRFARVHRSFIVPIQRIQAVRNQTIYLAEREIPIGRSYGSPLDK